MRKRIISLLLCISIVLGLIPLGSVVAVSTEAATNEFVNYGAVIGNTAHFNLDYYVNFLVCSNPSVFDYDVDWDDESNWIYHDEVAESYEAPESHVFSEDLILSIRNYYYDEENTALWYKVDAAPGYELPKAMQESCWVFMNYTEIYEEEGWQEWSADSIIVDNSGRNFVFDKGGNPVTSAEIGLYNTLNLTCRTTLAGSASYQWQILVGDEWAEIMGANTATIPVNYTLLVNTMDENSTAQLRCVTRSGSKTVEGEPVAVSVDTDFDYDNYVHPETPNEPETSVEPRMIKSARAGGVMTLAEGDKNVCYVTVQYLFENGTQAANSFVAEVQLNKEQSVTAIFPYVQGYLPYYEGVRQDELTITKSFTQNEIYTIIYEPTEVNYTVDIYFQNIENDDYSFYDSQSYTGLTGTKVPLSTGTFPGMRELLHETPTIAADGSTHVEVYYDRIYYMTRVYLAGGYGIYSVYARYGADLQGHLTAPTRPGYSFVGWDEYTIDSDDDGVPDTGSNGIADTVYPIVPAKNLAYVAVWVENATAQVNVVFWGQDANDDNKYSYLSTEQMQVAPGTELKYATDSGNLCGLSEHTHNNNCKKVCNLTEHTHTYSCYQNCTHTVHNELSCYTTQTLSKAEAQTGNTKTAFDSIRNNETAKNGYVYRYRYDSSSWWNPTTTYYNFIYVGGEWYYLGTGTGTTIGGVKFADTMSSINNNGGRASVQATSNNCNHQHTPDCVSCDGHIHNATCYSGCLAHTHSTYCQFTTFKGYDTNLWKLSEKEDIQETVTVERDGSTVLNVYFDRETFTFTFIDRNREIHSFTEKWGADINDRWIFTGSNGVAYPQNNTSWTPSGSSVYTQRITQLMIMPAENIQFTHTTSNNTKRTFNYYIQALPGEPFDKTLNGVNYTLYQTITHDFGQTYYNDDFFILTGMDRGIITDGDGKTVNLQPNGYISSKNVLNFHYTRTVENVLEFHSGNNTVRTEAPMYEQPLNIYADYTDPPLPSNMEEGSHEFAGWYLNPECTRPADLTTLTMPAGNLALYAKWVPNHHTVRIVLEKKDDGVYGPEDSVIVSGNEKVEALDVLHGTIVFSGNDSKIPPTPDNGAYKFLGWFYEDDGVELMWDFEHHPVVQDTVIYAKWSSELLVPYTIYFKDQNGTDVAAPIESSSLAGHTITVEAKAGNELYSSYRQGYFPNITSHSIPLTIDQAEDGVTYTFVYTQAEKKQYTVHYLDADNGNKEMTDSPIVKESSYAVVTEAFKSFADDGTYKDHVPDAYQKTLVLSSDSDSNHIYFYYTKSNTSGVWYVEHLVQNKEDGTIYDHHSDDGAVDDIGTHIIPVWPVDLSKDGYEFKNAVITNGSTTEMVTSWDQVQGIITKEGLSIQVYYDRIKYPYKVVYRNKDTNQEIHDSVVFTTPEEMKMYGSTAAAPATLPTINGYTYASSTTCTIVKDDPVNITKNIVYVYYTEQSIRLDFKVVGPDGCGTINPEYTYVKVNSDTGASCTAATAKGYRFVGWYSDAACNNVCTTDPMLILKKPDDGWAPVTYYAKFELGVAPLTIKRENAEADQVYVYKIQKNDDADFVIYVTVTGNSTVTIKEMPFATYTITQQNDWSWRYDDSAQSVDHRNVDGTTVTFGGSSKTEQWLNGNSQLRKNQRR